MLEQGRAGVLLSDRSTHSPSLVILRRAQSAPRDRTTGHTLDAVDNAQPKDTPATCDPERSIPTSNASRNAQSKDPYKPIGFKTCQGILSTPRVHKGCPDFQKQGCPTLPAFFCGKVGLRYRSHHSQGWPAFVSVRARNEIGRPTLRRVSKRGIRFRYSPSTAPCRSCATRTAIPSSAGWCLNSVSSSGLRNNKACFLSDCPSTERVFQP